MEDSWGSFGLQLSMLKTKLLNQVNSLMFVFLDQNKLKQTEYQVWWKQWKIECSLAYKFIDDFLEFPIPVSKKLVVQHHP